MDLKWLLSFLDIKADWIGLRAIKEQTTTRCARNGNFDPLTVAYDQGIMVEVLSQGQ
jgi:hypothetical protein